jgi:hypothetical protein
MYSFGVAQWVLAVWLGLVVLGTPVLRLVMIRNGAQGFVPWREFWGKWTVDFVLKSILVGLLWVGGFWG